MGANAVSAGVRGREDSAGPYGKILQQFADIVIRGKQVILAFPVINGGSLVNLATVEFSHRIHRPGARMKPGRDAQISKVFNGIVIRDQQASRNPPALTRRDTVTPAYVDFFVRFDHIDIASLLKCLQDPVNTFEIAVCQEILQTPCFGHVVKNKRFMTSIATRSGRDAADRIDNH